MSGTAARTAVPWLPCPITIYEICQRLKAAVEEREKFFFLDSGSSSVVQSYPLTIPARPFEMHYCAYSDSNRDHWHNSVFSGYNGSLPRDFIRNLRSRINRLREYTFNPLKLGTWNTYTYEGPENQLEIMKSMGIDTDAAFGAPPWINTRPFRYEDGKILYALADVLNRYIIYPRPPQFLPDNCKDNESSFGIDAGVVITDLTNGNSISRNFQPQGTLSLELSDGKILFAAPGDAAVYWHSVKITGEDVQKYRISAADQRLFYEPLSPDTEITASMPGAKVQLQGEFKIKLNITASFSANGSGIDTEEDSASRNALILTLRPGGSHDPIDLSWYQNKIDRVNTLTGRDDVESAEVRFSFSSTEIMLVKENYPELPYKYYN